MAVSGARRQRTAELPRPGRRRRRTALAAANVGRERGRRGRQRAAPCWPHCP